MNSSLQNLQEIQAQLLAKDKYRSTAYIGVPPWSTLILQSRPYKSLNGNVFLTQNALNI